MEQKPSFVFFGTPDVSSKTLELLKSHGYIPQLIVTAPDRPVGRHYVMTPSPTKVWAMENNIPFLQPEKITPDVITSLPVTDLYIVVAYGKILPQSLIDLPRLATLNIHYSLLPRWRGASPVEAAILHGDIETGVSIQKMVFKLDAGPVIAEEKLFITTDDTTQSLREKIIPMGAELLVQVLKENNYSGTEQDESQSTHCGKTKKEDALITLADDPQTLWNKYRAYHGWPCIYFLDADNKRVKITHAKFQNEQFIPEMVIPEGKKEMSWSEYNK